MDNYMKNQEFDSEIKKEDTGRLIFLTIPFNAKEVFCKPKGTILVSGEINNISYRGKLLSRGSGEYIFVVDKTLQRAVGFDGKPMPVHVKMGIDEVSEAGCSCEGVPTVSCDMDVITAIKNRKSIRKFTNQPISEEMLNTILTAGLNAPTARNKRPYHFIVVNSRELLKEFAQNNPNAAMLEQSACGIVVCGDKNVEGMREFLYVDCAAAIQNMLLCIHGLGLGGVWCGIVDNSDGQKFIAEKLKLPAKISSVAVIALGYPDEDKEIVERWDTSKIHYNTW